MTANVPDELGKHEGFEEVFSIFIEVDKPIVVGQDDVVGRRQLIPILSGEVIGNGFKGKVLPGGIDSQIIRPDGKCELSARYAIQLEDGASIYIENNGVRTVPAEYAEVVKAGDFIDPELYYFRTVPIFEVYDEKYKWLMNHLFICYANRLPDKVLLKFYKVL
ncbi:hypothetical protein COJ85_16965 [Bacillus sp. AFS076308]|uniref:DUF3237 domain-containing protein n=1 Tax=unclassified Bacillus (in: firmicutes) TaxID=185979 RepID=UPI000BF51700|nr:MULTISPECIES: DUF3237 domain-containing protein [unclassified Bacillus (in: firmicutes)]PFO01408.1 hypothetical protein COJ85_16965 [Bacillus sp. AFS076308]PGV52250.1 hypothetical protein COD92_11045 [Bacillus sp. AFS037270]